MASCIEKHTGNSISNVRLQKLPMINRRGSEYRILFTSTKQSHCCVLSNVQHSGNNIWMECTLHTASRLIVGCHSTKRQSCKRWRVVYEEKMDESSPPPEDQPTAIIPESVLKDGTHVQLCVWSMKPFRLHLPGFEDITNKTEGGCFFDMNPQPCLCNDGESYMAPEIRSCKRSGVVVDMCYKLVKV